LVGPSRLEIHLDGSYDFAKKVLDQPESRARIESEILKLTGETITVNLRLLAPQRPPIQPVPTPEPVASPAKSNVPNAANVRATEGTPKSTGVARPSAPDVPPQRNLLGEVDPGRDPFVRQVMDVFGATVVKVTVAPSVQIADTEAATES
jgi:hypothetical protein